MTHQKQLGLMCRKNARKRCGDGWRLLGPDLQEALIAREALTVVLMVANGQENNKGLQHVAAVARHALYDAP